MNDRPEETIQAIARLVARAQAGDAAAFGLLSARHQDRLFALCLQWTHNTADAEDLAQETLLKAHAHLAQIDDPARFTAWLFRIAINTCKNWRARDRQETLPLAAAQHEIGRGPEAGMDLAEQAAIRQALTALPAELRLAIRLFYLHGLTQKDLAARWRMPESTIKSRLDTGRRRLRRELEKMGLASETPAATGAAPSAGRIVIAAPERKAVAALVSALKGEGQVCTVVTQGRAILPRLRRLEPALLILLAAFADLEEFTLLQTLRQDAALGEMPVMFLVPAEKATDAHIQQGWKAGVDCYLTHPYQLTEAVKFVTMLLQSAPPPVLEADTLLEGEATLPRRRIAVADGDGQETTELRALLETEGHAVIEIGSGEMLLARLRRLMPDILILNIPFGVLDEYEILRAIRIDARLRPTSVMFLTPHKTEEDIYRGWKSGVDVYLTKPYNTAEVVAFVQRIDRSLRAADYGSLAIEFAWRQDTPRVLHCLAQVAELSGKNGLDAIKDDPAFHYLRHTNEFRTVIGELPAPS